MKMLKIFAKLNLKLLLPMFALGLFFAFPSFANAAVNNFTAASGEWNTAGNWSLGHVPNSSEDCTFTGLNGSGALTITGADAYCKSDVLLWAYPFRACPKKSETN